MIFYFSGTGNTLWAAQTLAWRLGERLVNMAAALQNECIYTLSPDERVGLVFPVHGWRTPRLVRRFLSRLTLQPTEQTHYDYLVVTAGDSIGRTVERLLPHLEAKGIHPQLFASLIMPESYVGLPFMDVDTSENEARKKREAAAALAQIADVVARRDGSQRDTSFQNLTRGPLPSFFSGPVGSFFERFLINDKPFHVSVDRCIRCGRCASVCPVGDIDGGKGRQPQWRHQSDCLTCFSCYHHCPTHAIEFGRRTRYKGQYYYTRNSTD